MPDYQKAKIYKLWSPQGEDDEVYYGSTCNDLRFRKSQHKSKNHNCKSKILFENYDDVRIELVEDYPCNNKQELNKKEGEFIKNNKCLNKVIPDRTKQEWYEDNKEKITKQTKEWIEKNKEKLTEYRKEYYQNNKEHISKWIKNNRDKINETQKEWNKKNKEKLAEYKKKYYLKNKEKNKL